MQPLGTLLIPNTALAARQQSESIAPALDFLGTLSNNPGILVILSLHSCAVCASKSSTKTWDSKQFER